MEEKALEINERYSEYYFAWYGVRGWQPANEEVVKSGRMWARVIFPAQGKEPEVLYWGSWPPPDVEGLKHLIKGEEVGMLKELFKQWDDAVRVAEKAAEELGKELVRILQPVLPKLRYSVGWAEGGVDTLCFWDEDRSSPNRDGVAEEEEEEGNELERLANVLGEVFGRGAVRFDTPFGLYLTKEEVERVKEVLKRYV